MHYLFECYREFWMYAGMAWDVTPWWAIPPLAFFGACFIMAVLSTLVEMGGGDGTFGTGYIDDSGPGGATGSCPTSGGAIGVGGGWFGSPQQAAQESATLIRYYIGK